jgi:hypothetical protein
MTDLIQEYETAGVDEVGEGEEEGGEAAEARKPTFIEN